MSKNNDQITKKINEIIVRLNEVIFHLGMESLYVD